MGLVDSEPKWAAAENKITQVVSAFAGAKAMGCDCGTGLGLAFIVAKPILSIEMRRTEGGIDRCDFFECTFGLRRPCATIALLNA